MRIKELKLYTKDLSKQTEFYANTLGLKLVENKDKFSVFQIGKTRLFFEQNNSFRPYHFAINISSNKEHEALYWLKQRVEILKYEAHEIQDFSNWNAKAIYFYDKDKNIVEFIARKNLDHRSESEFNSNDLLEVSEIGLPVKTIESTYNALNKITPLQIYDGGLQKFCAIGDEHGLFICINKNLKDWFPTHDKANSSEFKMTFEEKNQTYSIQFKKGEVGIL